MSDSPVRKPFSHTVMFWLLTSMGTIAALPCFLVPPIAALRDLREVQIEEIAKTEWLEQQLAQQRQFSAAVRSDPLVNLRLAQRELGYGKPGQRQVLQTGMHAPTQQSHDASPVDSAAALPEWIQRIYPQRFAYIYRHKIPRMLILFMSLGLILTSLALYAPQPESSP